MYIILAEVRWLKHSARFILKEFLSAFQPVDIVITMGCNVNCPYLPCKERADWGLDDPTGKSDEEFIKTATIIKEKILDLKRSE